MKEKLKEVTDLTVNELLNNEVILPSSYFKCFDKHAKNVDIEIDSESFEKELSELILEEYNTINGYVNSAVEVIDTAAVLTQEAQQAIKESNTLVLKNLYKQIKDLKHELEDITNNIYTDYLTKVHNKKWLFHKYLSKDATFKENTIVLLIDVKDYEYIAETYNKLISNNLIIYIAKYLTKKLKDEELDFEISRYLTNKFIITINKDDTKPIETLMSTITSLLFNTTLKSNSGILIRPTFDYAIQKARKDEAFLETLGSLLKAVKTKKK